MCGGRRRVFQVKNCRRLLFSDEPCQGGLASLSRSEHARDRVYLKRSFDLTANIREIVKHRSKEDRIIPISARPGATILAASPRDDLKISNSTDWNCSPKRLSSSSRSSIRIKSSIVRPPPAVQPRLITKVKDEGVTAYGLSGLPRLLPWFSIRVHPCRSVSHNPAVPLHHPPWHLSLKHFFSQ